MVTKIRSWLLLLVLLFILMVTNVVIVIFKTRNEIIIRCSSTIRTQPHAKSQQSQSSSIPFSHIVFFLPVNGTHNFSLLEPEVLHFPSMASTLCFSLLTLLSLVSSLYGLPDPLFINCGSNSNIIFSGQTFVSDDNYASGGSAVENLNTSSSKPPIYHTARIFTKKSWYELPANEPNTFVLIRLHFFAFSTKKFKLSDSRFAVSVSGFSLLSNFSVGDAIEIKELFIPTGAKTSYRIEFTPSDPSSPAFVNAIEAFTTPANMFTQGVPFPRSSPAGKIADLHNLTSDYAFNPIYRIDVGGLQTTEDERDTTLGRKWKLDDSFISNSSEGATNKSFDGLLKYGDNGATEYHAPAYVYKTAKQLNINSFNITWNFGVKKNATYLVRAHFCDVISTSLSHEAFRFFIYSHFSANIGPSDRVIVLAAPFFVDMVVDSVESQFMNIGIGATPGSNYTAFLNGVEIMELLKNSSEIDQENERKNINTIVLIVVGCVAFVLILLIGFFMGKKYQEKLINQRSQVMLSYGGDSYTDLDTDPSTAPHLSLNLKIPFRDILKATKNFDEKLMIGQGGFGKVYKGTLSNGRNVAVKRGGKGHGQGRPEFVTEIMVLSKIRHRHLVSLVGYCDEKSEMILVYEFMEKGTLQDHLYGNEYNLKLSWEQRLEICISAARGLHYLHTGSKDGIIHRDVKSTNILLNDLYVAKVADFGISCFDNVDESGISDIKGSFGYMDPEYAIYMKVTQKSDVYAFGVVLVEVLCARPVIGHNFPDKEVNLADWAKKHIKCGNVENIIDPFLMGTINMDSLRIFLTLVERCLKDLGEERPTMIEVQRDLEYALGFQQLVDDDSEFYKNSTINTSLQFPMSVIERLPSCINHEFEVNDSSSSSYPSESQVFSQLGMKGAR
ncbi:hypothetical protein Lser_V15G20044 [Lactuca serriola]